MEGLDPSPARIPLPPRSYPEMILEAIDALKDDDLSNELSILGYIKGKYSSSLPPKDVSLVRSHLARMVCAGEVALNHNNYHRPDANAKRGRRRRRRRKPKVRAPEPFIGARVTPSEAFLLGAIDANASKGFSPPPFPLPHPPYPEMIFEALQALNNENGSDSSAIAGYIEDKYGDRLTLRHRHLTSVMGNLSLMKARGEVLSVNPAEDAEPCRALW